MKCLLLLGMLLGHTLFFVYDRDLFFSKYYVDNKYFLLALVAEFLHLITFSGYFFCWGFLCNIVYFNSSKPKQVRKKIFYSAIRMLIAYYISAFSYRFLFDPGIKKTNVINILKLKDVPGFSEFILAYFGLMLVILIFFPWIRKISKLNGYYIILFSILLFSLSYIIPYDKIGARLGLYLGSTKYALFPILLYFPYFLLGVYFSKSKRIKQNVFVIIFLMFGTASYIVYFYKKGVPPTRFPPRFEWLVGAMFFVYMYYVISICLDKWIVKNNNYNMKNLSNFAILLGQNTLFYLILSNIFLFAYDSIFEKQNIFNTIIIYLIVIFVPYYLLIIARPIKRIHE
ncbi:hypothetical protein ETU08_04665 [Apibacter muscae]|uniref:Acyltransferase n=1 Tax=Apibacter muscae TaxID=2509004 RepID=A0A563DFH6_9FLAO|nr:hypothetical protein [Apibacter muscae]TWP29028.1 hypothetical protein ETU09_04095 [Apibacter muscae]TWP30391.1 hypothetical protein ETU08_04665 [Apibacter muscae]